MNIQTKTLILGINICSLFALNDLSQCSALAAEAKMSTYQRQVNLMKRINDAQKKKELTVRQAKSLRKDLSKVAVKKQKVRDKNIGNEANEDMTKVESRLTEISAKIDELKTENIKDKED